MTAIRDFVMAEPLFETHTHQNRFDHHPWDRKNYEEFIQYGTADMATASGRSFDDLVKRGKVFNVWRFVRTTGYGQAAELGCRDLFGLAYTKENAPAITERIQAFIRERTPEKIFRDLYDRANVRWSVCDQCWESPVNTLQSLSGKEHLDLFRFAIRHDELLTPHSKADIAKASQALGKDIRTLSGFVKALDEHTAKVQDGGRLAAIKIGLAYLRNLDFEPASKAAAERAFSALMQGRKPALKPLHDYLFFATMDRAVALKLPVQIHTGYLAGNWSDIRRGNPAGLIPVFRKYQSIRFDIFHASWPWSEFLGAVGKEFPNVWIDLCWMWSMNPVQAGRVLDEWLSAVPNNKVLGFGADTGTPFGMLGYALQARQGIAGVLERKIARGEYDEETARFVARRVMWENGRELYGEW